MLEQQAQRTFSLLAVSCYDVVVWTACVEYTWYGTELLAVLLAAGLAQACDGLKLRGDTSYIASGEDSEHDGNRSICQSLVLIGHGGVRSAL